MSYLFINDEENILINKAGENIYLRIFSGQNQSKTTILGASKHDCYSCCICPKGIIHIAYKDNYNNLIHLHGKNDDFHKQIILEDHENKYDIDNINILSREKTYIFYTALNPTNNQYDLVFHQLSANMDESPHSIVTLPSITTKYICEIHHSTLRVLLAIPRNNQYDLNCYAYDIPTSKWLGYDTVLSTNNQITNYSFFTYQNTLHISYVTESYGHMTLYYTALNIANAAKIIATTTHSKKVASKGSKIISGIFAYHETIWIVYKTQGTLYCVYSLDQGLNFSEPIKTTVQKEHSHPFTIYSSVSTLKGHQFFGYISGYPTIAVLSQIDIENLLYHSSVNFELRSLITETLMNKTTQKYIEQLESDIKTLQLTQKNIIQKYDELREFTKKVQNEGKKWKKKYSQDNEDKGDR